MKALPRYTAYDQRAVDSFEGSGCDCRPERTSEDGYQLQAHTCLLCELKAALKLAGK